MFGKLKYLLNDKKLISSKETWHVNQKKAESVRDYVDSLIQHLNEVALIINNRNEVEHNGRIFRIGITRIVDNKIVPLPLVKSKELDKVFIDEFLIMPVEATSLGKILETGKGDTIKDMEEHLGERRISISSQIALKWGVKSNMRMPYHTIKNSGIIFFSADVTYFFNDELFEYIESLIPEVESYLNIANDFDALMKVQEELVNKEGDTLHSNKLFQGLQLALEKAVNPFSERIKYEQKIFMAGEKVSGNLIDLWKVNENKLAILLLESDVNIVDSAKMSIYLRGMFLKETRERKNVADVVKALERYYWEYLDSEPVLTSTNEMVSIFFGELDLEKQELTYANVGFIHPLICHKGEGTVDVLGNTGLYFGSMDQNIEEKTVSLKQGERLFLATSSFLQILNDEKKLLGMESLHEVIKESHSKELQEVCHVIYDKATELDNTASKKYDAIFAAIEML